MCSKRISNPAIPSRHNLVNNIIGRYSNSINNTNNVDQILAHSLFFQTCHIDPLAQNIISKPTWIDSLNGSTLQNTANTKIMNNSTNNLLDSCSTPTWVYPAYNIPNPGGMYQNNASNQIYQFLIL